MQQSAHQGLQPPAACISASWHCKRFSMRSVCALQAVQGMKGSAMVLWLSEDSAIPSSPAGDTGPLSNIAGFNHKKTLAPCTSFVVWAACTVAGGFNSLCDSLQPKFCPSPAGCKLPGAGHLPSCEGPVDPEGM